MLNLIAVKEQFVSIGIVNRIVYNDIITRIFLMGFSFKFCLEYQ